jgi:hypothetical protein
VVGVGEERALVSSRAVMWLEAEAREVAAARRQSGEGKMRRGGENLAGAGVSVLKGSGGEGAQRGGHHVEAERERERERGGPGRGVEQRGGVASTHQRPGCGVHGRLVIVRQWRAAGSARRGTAWLQVGQDTTWAWSSAAGCGARQRGEAVGAALTGGAGSTVRPICFSNRINFISNGFKFVPNFVR